VFAGFWHHIGHGSSIAWAETGEIDVGITAVINKANAKVFNQTSFLFFMFFTFT
jgi:hypothetical protein